MGLIAGTVWGHYDVIGKLDQANCVIGQTFGNHLDKSGQKIPGPVNEALAQFIIDLDLDPEIPLLLQREVAIPFHALADRVPDLVMSEHRIPGKYFDSWEVLAQAWGRMQERHYETAETAEKGLASLEIRPLIVAQAHHVGRVAMQARKRGMKPIVPANLPALFNSGSTQPWTRSRGQWARRELWAIPFLKLKGKI